MIVLGLTGSIGMGKSTTADMFRAFGVPVHDADAVVHGLYSGPLANEIEKAFPGSVTEGVVDRARLGAVVLNDRQAMKRLEAIVHPAVHDVERTFLADARNAGHPVAILEVPLLFETGGDQRCDKVVVVTAPAEVQRARVLARPGMTETQFASILEKQLPDSEKRMRADFLVETHLGLDHARMQVGDILATLRAEHRDSRG